MEKKKYTKEEKKEIMRRIREKLDMEEEEVFLEDDIFGEVLSIAARDTLYSLKFNHL